MKINHVPKLNLDNPTHCCPRFLPKEWENKTLALENKPFIRVTTRSLFHIPLNMGRVISKTWKVITAWKAADPKEFVMLSRDLSPWESEHYFWVAKPVPVLENVRLSGCYLTHVFEGPFQDAPKWLAALNDYVHGKGAKAESTFLYYTTCPKCAKFYGHNYVVGLAKIQ